MRRLHLSLIALPLVLGACSLTDSIQNSVGETLAVGSVDFSSADPAYTGPDVTFTGNLLNPHLSDFNLGYTFHVKADNSKNSQRASFGQSTQVWLNLYINDRNSTPTKTTIAPFSIEGGQVGTLDIPVSISVTTINTTVLKKILNGDNIPYYLTGSLSFSLLGGSVGTSEVDLTIGEIPTRPSGSLITLLQSIL